MSEYSGEKGEAGKDGGGGRILDVLMSIHGFVSKHLILFVGYIT